MKLWKIMLAMLVAVLMISAVAMAEDCEHNSVVILKEVVRVYQISDENEHQVEYKVTYGCNKCNDTATYTYATEYGYDYCAYSIKGETVAATCTKGEYTKYYCACGGYEEKANASKPALGHNWETNKVVDKGDCQTFKKIANVCKRCEKVDGLGIRDSVYKGDHVWQVSKVEPTCTKDGWEYKTCTVKNCGKEEDKVIKSDGSHRWDYAETEIVAPTCEDQGYSIVKCQDCGFTTKHDYTNALGHDYKYHAAVEAKCNQEGCKAYWTCDRCPKMFDGDDANKEIYAIPTIPVNTNGHEFLEGSWSYNLTSCTSNNNSRTATCLICKKSITEKIPAAEHKFADPAKLAGKAAGTYAGIGVVTKASTCDKTGEGYVVCTVCRAQAQLNVTIPAQGHNWNNWTYGPAASCTTDMIATRTCKNNSTHKEYQIVVAATGHNWKVIEESSTATCEKAGVCSRVCTNAGCGVIENNVVVPALGHKYEEKITAAATCTKDGEKASTCSVCGDTKTEKIPAAHGATKEEVATKPVCGVEGTINVICTVCDAKVGTKAIEALAHEYEWKVVSKPSEAGNGKNEYRCNLCGDVAKVETIKFHKYYYNNTMTSFGPMTKDLVGGSDWYRVTPVDLTVDGVYTYDLVASNKYIVGKVTIAVNAGTLTVSYKANYGVDVKEESLLIYASKADLAAGSAITAPVGAAINVAETFGADTQVLVSLILTGDYDAAGKPLVDASAAASMAANID